MDESLLLDQLLADSRPVPVYELAGRLQWSQTQTRHILDRLSQAGCEFEDHPSQGVGLKRSGLGVWADYLEHRDVESGRIHIYRSTASTQDAARRIGGDRTLVIADHQTRGRGRLGRGWVAPPGCSILLSRVVDQSDPGASVDRLTFTAAVAVARTLDHWLGPIAKQAMIKWPNDVLVDHKKIAGILVETHTSPHQPYPIATLGIGLNIELQTHQVPADLRPHLTSLAMTGLHVDRLAVLSRLIHQLDAVIERDQSPSDLTHLVNDWRQRSTLVDQPATFQSEGRTIAGTVVDLEPTAGLILRTHTGHLRHLPAATTRVLDRG